jgi:hypothetical protein
MAVLSNYPLRAVIVGDITDDEVLAVNRTRHYRLPAADVIRDQIEIVRESRRLTLHMQASDAA